MALSGGNRVGGAINGFMARRVAHAVAHAVRGAEPGCGPDRFAGESHAHPLARFSKASGAFPVGAFAGVDGVPEVDPLQPAPTPAALRSVSLVYSDAAPAAYVALLAETIQTACGRAVTLVPVTPHPIAPVTPFAPGSIVLFADERARTVAHFEPTQNFPFALHLSPQLRAHFTEALLDAIPDLAPHLAHEVLRDDSIEILLTALLERGQFERIVAVGTRQDPNLEGRLQHAAALAHINSWNVAFFETLYDGPNPSPWLARLPGTLLLSDTVDGEFPVPYTGREFARGTLWDYPIVLQLLDWNNGALRSDVAEIVREALRPTADAAYDKAVEREASRVAAKLCIATPLDVSARMLGTRTDRETTGWRLMDSLRSVAKTLGPRHLRTVNFIVPAGELAEHPDRVADAIWDVLTPTLDHVVSHSFPEGADVSTRVRRQIDERLLPTAMGGGALCAGLIGLLTGSVYGMGVFAGLGAVFGAIVLKLAGRDIYNGLFARLYTQRRVRYEATIRAQPFLEFPIGLSVTINNVECCNMGLPRHSNGDAYCPTLGFSIRASLLNTSRIGARLKARLDARMRAHLAAFDTDAPAAPTAVGSTQ